MNPIALTGNLGERHKLLNDAVNKACIENKSFDDFTEFHPKTDADGLIKVDIASHFKRVDYLFEIFKSDDSLLKSKALKCVWFFEGQVAPEVSRVGYLDKTLFPHISHRTMHRIVHAMSARLKNETFAGEYFTHFNDSESFPLAVKFLPRCSIAFIRRVLSENQINLTETQLMKITERDVALGYEYFKNKDNRKRICEEYLKVVRLMAANDTHRFLDFYDNFLYPEGLTVTLGMKTSAKIMKEHNNKIIQNIEKYRNLLKQQAVSDALNPDELKSVLKELISNDFTSDCDLNILSNFFQLSDLFLSYTKNIKKDKQLALFKEIYESICESPFSIDLLDDDGNWKKIVSKEDLQKWALSNVNGKVPYECDDKHFFKWYKYVDFIVAFPRLKDLVKAEPKANERMSILETIVDSYCIERRNADLLQLLEYFFKFHVNEQLKVTFLHKLLDNTVIYRYADESWKFVDEIFHSNNVYEFANSDWPKPKVWGEIIRRNLLKGTETPEECFKAYVEYTGEYAIHEQDIVDIEFEEKVFKSVFGAHIRNFNAKSDKSYEKINSLYNILAFITQWNEKHTKNKKTLSDYPSVLTFMENQSKDLSSYHLKSYLKTDPDFLRTIIDIFLINNIDEVTCAYFLKHKPETLSNPSEIIIKNMTESYVFYKKFYKKLRTYFPNDVGKFWTTHYLEILTKPDNKGRKLENCVFALSILLEKESYVAQMKPYIPSGKKIKRSETSKDNLERTKYVAKHSRFVRPLVSPDTVLSFTKGDDLQFILGSLISLCHQYHSAKAKEIVMSLIDNPVSVQKHGIRLLFKLFDGPDVSNMIMDIWEKSKNASIRYLILKNVVKLFTKVNRNATRERYWPSLEAIIGQLAGEADDKLFKYLVDNANVVHKDYYSKYCECCWSALAKLDDKTYKFKFLETMHERQADLSTRFCSSVILNYLQAQISTESIFKKSALENFDDQMVRFIPKFLICASDENAQDDRILQIYETLTKELKRIRNTKRDTSEIAERAVVYFGLFLNNLLTQSFTYFSEFMNSKKLLAHILADMSTFLSHSEGFNCTAMARLVYLHHDVFEPIRLIKLENNADLTPEFLNSISECWVTFGRKCGEMLHGLIESYFPQISILFQNTFNDFICNYLKLTCTNKRITKDFIKLNIAKGLISYDGDQNSVLVALRMLPKNVKDDLSKDLYKEIINSLKISDRIEVVYFLNFHLKG